MQYKNRIKQLQSYLKEHDLDAFLVMTRMNRQYLSAFTGSKGVLLVTRHSAKLFVDDRYTIRAKKESFLPVRPLVSLDSAINKGRVGVEDELTLHQMQKLRQTVKGVSWKVTRRAVDHIRAIKEASELTAMRKASKIIDAAFRHVKKLLTSKKQFTETQIALEIERFGKARGAQDLAFDPIVAFAENAAAPHHFSSTKKKIGRNNFLLLDFGFIVDGYNSDFTRTLFIGQPNKKQEKIYNTVLAAQQRGISVVRSGMLGLEVDNIIRSYIEDQGFGDKFTHCSGHGVGLEIHEAPNLCSDSSELLFDNTVVTIEPGIYLEGWGGVRIEDMVEVTDKQPRVFSKIPKDFKSMIIK